MNDCINSVRNSEFGVQSCTAKTLSQHSETTNQVNRVNTLEGTFLHVPGVGPKTEAKLRAHGFTSWEHVLVQPKDLPVGSQTAESLVKTLSSCRDALAKKDIQYFIDCFPIREQWRILANHFGELSYFDIETSGLSYESYVTCVACYHKGELHTFVHGENLDDFLDMLEDVPLLVSFNGSSFDIPQLLHTWHIPEFPCPHIDLRWQCYHDRRQGGLKHIERELGIQRPEDLEDVDGAEAVWLWFRWIQYQDQAARERLIRYCAADVLTLPLVTEKILSNRGFEANGHPADTLWSLLDKHEIYYNSSRP